MQGYVPFRTDMRSTFKIDGGRVLFDRIDLTTEGVESVLNGDVNLTYLAGADAAGEVHDRSPEDAGDLLRGRHLQAERDEPVHRHVSTSSRSRLPDGKTRTGRELKGDFVSASAGVNDMRFDQLRGMVRWTPEVLRISEATTKIYGGDARFTYLMAPLNAPGVTPRATFDAAWDDIDLTAFTNSMRDGGHPAGGPPVREERSRVAPAPLLGADREGGASHHAA